MRETERVEFHPPKDFVPPEGIEAGKDWDLVCSFRTKPDGRICLTQLGDAKMPGYDGKEENHREEKPDYKEYASGMMGQMQPQGAMEG